MAHKKISELADGGAQQAGDIVPIVRGGQNFRVGADTLGDIGLRDALAAPGGAGMSGYDPEGAYTPGDVGGALQALSSGLLALDATLSAASTKLARVVDAEDFGAVGDGLTDNASALQAALDSGVPVWLHRGRNYAFGSRLLVPDNGGFVGGGRLTMLTGAGKFDRSSNAGDAWEMVGVYALNKANIVLECEAVMQPNAETRTCSPFAIRGCDDPHIDVKLSGFDAPFVPMVAWDSNIGGYARVRGWDCGTDDASETRQVTLFGIDANRTGGNSYKPRFDIYGSNILNSGAEVASHGYQTDICNIQTTGYLGAVGVVRGKDCGEILDCFGDGNVIQVIAENAYEYGVKLIHGAENNIIDAAVNGFRRYGFVMGSDSTTKPVRRNRVRLTVTGGGLVPKTDFVADVANASTTLTVTSITSGLNIEVGDVIHDGRFPPGTTIAALGTGTGGVGTYTTSAAANATASGVSVQTSPALTAAVATDGTSATFKPSDNHVEVSYTGDGTHLDYGVQEAAGSNNVFVIHGDGAAIARSVVDSTGAGTGDTRSRFVNSKAVFVSAYCNAQVIAPGAFTALQYANGEVDRTGEWDASTYTFTADGEKTVVLSARFRHGGAAAGALYDFQVRKSGSEVLRKQQYASAAGNFSMETGPVLIRLSKGDTLDVRLNHGEAGNITVSSSQAFSALSIQEV